MENLNELENALDKMMSDQTEKRVRTFVARFKGKNIVTSSGKSSWKAVNHAKAAIRLHFSELENAYKYGYELGTNFWNRVYTNKFTIEEREQREKDFMKKLWELIEFKELE
jgi:hypothetical protein